MEANVTVEATGAEPTVSNSSALEQSAEQKFVPMTSTSMRGDDLLNSLLRA